jgi:hypothetical protein
VGSTSSKPTVPCPLLTGQTRKSGELQEVEMLCQKKKPTATAKPTIIWAGKTFTFPLFNFILRYKN